jgi:hypothetical protein
MIRMGLRFAIFLLILTCSCVGQTFHSLSYDNKCPANTYYHSAYAECNGNNCYTVVRCYNCPDGSSAIGGVTYAEICQCKPGYTGFLEDGIPCTQCSPGKYKPVKGPAACNNCAAGKYSAASAVTAEAACTRCDRGKYSTVSAATSVTTCTECENGKTSSPGSAYCSAFCAAGTYDTMCTDSTESIGIHSYGPFCSHFTQMECNAQEVNYPGICSKCCQACWSIANTNCPMRLTRNCQNCAAGKYSNIIDAGVCNDCPAGSYSPAGSSALAACKCNTGFSGMNGGTCTQCNAGTYSLAGTTESTCQTCPTNSTSPAGSTEINACVANAGYIGQGSTITPCPTGTFKSTSGSAAVACLPCLTGSSSPAGSFHVNFCVANNGFFGNPGGPFTACGLGTYSSATGATACVSCGNFAVTLSTGSTSAAACVCQIGYTNGTTSSRRLLTYESTHVPQGPPTPYESTHVPQGPRTPYEYTHVPQGPPTPYESTHVPQGPPTPPLLIPTISRHRQTPQSPQSLRIEYGFSRQRRLFGRRSLDVGTCSPCQPYYKNATGNVVCTSCPTSMYSPDGLSCVFKLFNTTSSLKMTSPSIQSSVASTTTAFQNTTTTIVTTTPAPVVVQTSTSIYIITARTTPAPVSETQTNNVFLVIGIVCGCFMLLCLCLICCLCFSFESNDRKEEYKRKLLD